MRKMALAITGILFLIIFTSAAFAAPAQKKIIFVCTGNTCRSPMAEGIAKKIVADNHLFYAISSRATKIDPAEVVANPKSLEVMKARGIDISKHQSRMVTAQDVKSASLILTMTQSHKNGLLALFPEVAPYTFTLTEYATGEQGDISDPWGKELPEYVKTADQLNILIPQAIRKFDAEQKNK